MSINPAGPEHRPPVPPPPETHNPGPPERRLRDAEEAAPEAGRAPDPAGPHTTDQGVDVDDTDN